MKTNTFLLRILSVSILGLFSNHSAFSMHGFAPKASTPPISTPTSAFSMDDTRRPTSTNSTPVRPEPVVEPKPKPMASTDKTASVPENKSFSTLDIPSIPEDDKVKRALAVF